MHLRFVEESRALFVYLVRGPGKRTSAHVLPYYFGKLYPGHWNEEVRGAGIVPIVINALCWSLRLDTRDGCGMGDVGTCYIVPRGLMIICWL